MRISDSLAESFLKRSGTFTKKQLADLRAESRRTHKSLQDLIVQNGLLSEADLTRLYASELQLPFVELPEDGIEPEILNLVPERIAHRFNVVAFAVDDTDQSVLVAMEDPRDEFALSFLNKQLGQVRPHVAASRQLKNALDQYRAQRASEQLKVLTREALSPNRPIDPDLAAMTVQHLLTQAAAEGASDIHIEPQIDHVLIRYRIDGLLHEVYKLPLQALEPLVQYVKMAGHLKAHQLGPQSGRLNVVMNAEPYSIRVSTLPTIDGDKIVLHLLPELTTPPSLRDIGLWGASLNELQRAILQPQGMILVAGPNGSGKSMSLYSLVSTLSSPRLNVASLEDPVEHRIAGANQVQVNSDVSFLAGLKAILSQDPNIIMISDIRDSEFSKRVLQAASSGHLIFGALHAGSAAAGLRRFIELGNEPYVVAHSVRISLSQRLPRRLCPRCRESIKPDTGSLKQLEKVMHLSDQGGFRRLHELEGQAIQESIGVINDARQAGAGDQFSTSPRGIHQLWRAREGGCEYCRQTGYRGRLGIFELLHVGSPAIQKVILHDGSTHDIQRAAIEGGMISLQIDGLVKALRGLTTVEEVLRVTAHGLLS